MTKKRVIVSIASDIGLALAENWAKEGFQIKGTYRTFSQELANLQQKYNNIECVELDLSRELDRQSGFNKFIRMGDNWDTLVFATGTQDPIGNFDKVKFDDWKNSINVNFISQLHILHSFLLERDQSKMKSVIFFAGGGTNNATLAYSAYTLSKIGLIKASELFDAEVGDCKFSILGPGWVKTKIHRSTLAVGKEMAGENFERTQKIVQ